MIPRLLLVLSVLEALAGCTPATQSALVTSIPPAAATISAEVLSPQDLAKAQTICAVAAPILQATTAPGMPATVAQTAVYPKAYCDALASAPQGAVPATTTPTTPSWLLSTIGAVAQLAGVILPLVL